jgi:hypothetical protein
MSNGNRKTKVKTDARRIRSWVAVRDQHSVFRFPFSVFRFPFSVFHFPFSVFRFPFSVLRSNHILSIHNPIYRSSSAGPDGRLADLSLGSEGEIHAKLTRTQVQISRLHIICVRQPRIPRRSSGWASSCQWMHTENIKLSIAQFGTNAYSGRRGRVLNQNCP